MYACINEWNHEKMKNEIDKKTFAGLCENNIYNNCIY